MEKIKTIETFEEKIVTSIDDLTNVREYKQPEKMAGAFDQSLLYSFDKEIIAVFQIHLGYMVILKKSTHVFRKKTEETESKPVKSFVRCVDNTGAKDLTMFKEYEIEVMLKDCIGIKNDKGKVAFYSESRFSGVNNINNLTH